MLEQEADENMVQQVPYCPRCGTLWPDGIVMGLQMVSHWRQTLTGYGPFRFDIEYERL